MREGIVLVLGGARSGKSAFAEKLVIDSGLAAVYIATAEAGDDEMRARIDEHRRWRSSAWRTVEAPLELEEALTEAAGVGSGVLVDCLTVWLSNLMLSGQDVEARGRALAETVSKVSGLRVLVSNEVGLGIVPENVLARRFRDAQGRLNQRMATVSDRVVFMAAGLPLVMKGATT
jgi:adenosylcobinamide kinase/adenosylcobinamide-phosphate guanylyltransferase